MDHYLFRTGLDKFSGHVGGADAVQSIIETVKAAAGPSSVDEVRALFQYKVPVVHPSGLHGAGILFVMREEDNAVRT